MNRVIIIFYLLLANIPNFGQASENTIQNALIHFQQYEYEKAESIASIIISDSRSSDLDKSRSYKLIADIHLYVDPGKARKYLNEAISLLSADPMQDELTYLADYYKGLILLIYPDSVNTTIFDRLQSLFNIYDSLEEFGTEEERSISLFFQDLSGRMFYNGSTDAIEQLITKFLKGNNRISLVQQGQIFYDLAEQNKYTDTLKAIQYYKEVKAKWKDLEDDKIHNSLARIELTLLGMDRKLNKKNYDFDDLEILDLVIFHVMKINSPISEDSMLMVDALEEKFMIFSDFQNPMQYRDSVIVVLEKLLRYYPSYYKDMRYYIRKIDFTYALMSSYLMENNQNRVKEIANSGLALCQEFENASFPLTNEDIAILNTRKIVFSTHVDNIQGLALIDDFTDEISIRDKVLFLQNKAKTDENLGLMQEALSGHKTILALLNSLEDKTEIDSIGLFAAAKNAALMAPMGERIQYGEMALNYYPKQQTIVSKETIQGKCHLMLKMADQYLKVHSNQEMFFQLIDKVLEISQIQGFNNYLCDAYLSLAFHYNSIREFDLQHKYLLEVDQIFNQNEDIKYNYYDTYNMCHALFYIVTGNHGNLYPYTRRIKEFYDSAGYRNHSHEVTTLLSIGSLYANFVNLDTALYYIDEAIRNLNSRVSNYELFRFFTSAAKGVAYENFGELSKAKLNYESALDFVHAKQDLFVQPDVYFNTLVHLYCINVRYFNARDEELELLEQKIESISSSLDMISTESLLNNYLLYYSFWSERQRSLDLNNTLLKMEEVMKWAETVVLSKAKRGKNNIAYRIAIFVNAYLNVNSYSDIARYKEFENRFQWMDEFIDLYVPVGDKVHESKKLFQYFMGLIASRNGYEGESLRHLQKAMDIPFESIGYQTELTYLYYTKLFDNAIAKGNDQQALEAISGVENIILKADKSELNYFRDLQNKLSILARFYIIKDIEPPSFFYFKIIESHDMNSYRQGINNLRMKAITYLQQNPEASIGSVDPMYFLNFNINEHMFDPASTHISELLPKGGALLFIFKTYRNNPDHYMGIVMKKSGENVLIDLGPDNQLELLGEQRKYLDNYNELYHTYWKKIDTHLTDVDHLVLIAEGVYQKLNPMVLKDDTGIYLVDKYEIDILSTILDLYFRGFEVAINTKKIALLGNPAFSYDSTLTYNTGELEFVDLNRGGSGNKSWITLPGTGTEVIAIKEAFSNYDYKVDVALGNDASESFVRTISNPEILHLATHGFVNPDDKVNSNGLVLSGANETKILDYSDTNDGYLFANDISKMNLMGTKLVALSACETGLSTTNSLDFRRAFFMAGAENILVSLWKIDDQATQDLMSRFYSSLAQTNRMRLSFQDTQDYMKEKYKNPYYWGSFILVSTSLDTQLK